MAKKYRIVITPKQSFFKFNLKELLHYRDLIFLLVKKHYSLKYKQTLIGPLWLIVNPVLTILLNTIIFGNLAALSTDEMPKLLFYTVGNTIWGFFGGSILRNADTFMENTNLFGKVYFPRIVVPIANVFIQFIEFLIQFFLMICLMVYYSFCGVEFSFSWTLILVPLVLLQLGFLGMGIGILISSITVKYRDLGKLSGFIVAILQYACPIVYSLSVVPERFKFLYMLNPATPGICIFKNAILGIGECPIFYWLISFIVTIIFSLWGIMCFNKTEKTFMDKI